MFRSPTFEIAIIALLFSFHNLMNSVTQGLAAPMQIFFFALLIVLADRVIKTFSFKNISILGIVLFLFLFCRFENIIHAFVFSLAITISFKFNSKILLIPISVASVFLASTLFRKLYFGDYFPLPSIAKSSGHTSKIVDVGILEYLQNLLSPDGVKYVQRFFDNEILLIAFIAIFFGFVVVRKSEDLAKLLFVGFSIIGTSVLVVLNNKGDWMGGGRLLVQVIPVLLFMSLKILDVVFRKKASQIEENLLSFFESFYSLLKDFRVSVPLLLALFIYFIDYIDDKKTNKEVRTFDPKAWYNEIFKEGEYIMEFVLGHRPYTVGGKVYFSDTAGLIDRCTAYSKSSSNVF